jgi:predicted permease
LLELERQNIGFDRHRVLLVRTDPRLADYKPVQLLPLYQQLDARLNTLPGVVSASIARFTPESGSVSSNRFSLEGYTPPRGKKMELFTVEVAPGFTETLRIPLLLGRSIERSDLRSSKPVTVVNETFVRTFLPHVNAIGRRLALGSQFKSPGVEIVGVTADAKYYDVRDQAKPMAYFSAWQGQGFTPYIGEIVISTIGEPFTVLAAVRKTLQSVDNRLPILDVRTLDEQVDSSFGQHRVVSELAGLFSGLALLLAAVGIYGSNAYMVARRTSEMGIRMALGAQRGDVLWMIFREALLVVAAGIVVGLPTALLASRVIRSFLFGITAWDASALVGATVLIAVAGLFAGYLPAQRATKIDPMRVLRYE